MPGQLIFIYFTLDYLDQVEEHQQGKDENCAFPEFGGVDLGYEPGCIDRQQSEEWQEGEVFHLEEVFFCQEIEDQTIQIEEDQKDKGGIGSLEGLTFEKEGSQAKDQDGDRGVKEEGSTQAGE